MAQFLPVFASPSGEAITLDAYNAVVRRWPVAHTELDIATSFGTTHVIASGREEAEPVVLLHAYFATATSWYRTAGALSEHYRVYAVDVVGDVGKSRPTRPIKSLDEFAQWLTELSDALGISRMHLVGNSIGGFIAAGCGMRLKERVSKLALISPAATFHSMAPFYFHMFIPKLLHLVLPWLPGSRRAMDRAVDWMNAGLPGDGPWDELFRLALLHGMGTNQVFPRVYSAEELAQIKAPTLLMVGDHEQIYPPSAAIAAAKRRMPGITTELIPGAHHIAAVAQPELVNRRLLQFLSQTM
ncbi:MAG TPA: alpha/beta fold hydrolase [Symbiobacteriaceae bacterium]|nr:alpha/beta fold hydrolase [Symbiobacteriaceae bacterium]